MGQRSEALAARLEQGARALATAANGFTDAQWQRRVKDGRKVGVVVHHVAVMYPLEIQLAQKLALGEPVAGVSLGDCTLALYRLGEAGDPSLWGRAYERPCTHLMALRVEDLPAAADATARSGVAAVRADADLVVLDPAATGGVQVALTRSLLPGDPRP